MGLTFPLNTALLLRGKVANLCQETRYYVKKIQRTMYTTDQWFGHILLNNVESMGQDDCMTEQSFAVSSPVSHEQIFDTLTQIVPNSTPSLSFQVLVLQTVEMWLNCTQTTISTAQQWNMEQNSIKIAWIVKN